MRPSLTHSHLVLILKVFLLLFPVCKGGLISLTMILSLIRKSCKVGSSELRFRPWRGFTKEPQRSHSHVHPHLGEELSGGHSFSIPHVLHPSLPDLLCIQQMRWLLSSILQLQGRDRQTLNGRSQQNCHCFLRPSQSF